MAEKCGFIPEGLIRNDYKKSNGEIVDLIYYGKINKTTLNPDSTLENYDI